MRLIDGAVKEKVSSELEPGRMRRGQVCNRGERQQPGVGRGSETALLPGPALHTSATSLSLAVLQSAKGIALGGLGKEC